MNEEVAKGERRGPKAPPTERTTWIQCENGACGKWRRVLLSEVPEGAWFCHQNSDTRYKTCAVPQELPDSEIDRLMEQSALDAFVRERNRPPLDRCSGPEFEADLIAFHRSRGGEQLARQIRDKRIMCNTAPMDMLGLYRAVIGLGGLQANESYDEGGRWTGNINFSGAVFPKMSNYTENNKATSIGNQLLSNYKKYLLPYEQAYAAVDITFKPGPWERKSSAKSHRPSAPSSSRTFCRPKSREGGSKSSRVRSSRAEEEGSDPLAVLATVVSAAPEQGAEEGVGGHQPSRKLASFHTVRNTLRDPQLGQERQTDVAYIQSEVERVASYSWVALQNDVPHSSDVLRPGTNKMPVPGELLLVEDPFVSDRLWPIVVAAAADLPRAVSEGASCCEFDCASTSGRSLGVLSSHEEATSSPPVRNDNTPGDAVPALLVGTSMLGWVNTARCRLYSQAETEKAASRLLPRELRQTRCSAGGGSANPSRYNVFARAVKEAVAVYHSQNQRAHARSLVQRVSTQLSAARLLVLEADLPAVAFMCQSSALWQGFRQSARQAASPSDLIPQVLQLAHQLSPSVLRPHSREEMWLQLQSRLMMAAPGAVSSLVDGNLGRHPSGASPSCAAVDDAVAAIEDAIDWEAAATLWEFASDPTTVSTMGTEVMVRAATTEEIMDLPPPTESPNKAGSRKAKRKASSAAAGSGVAKRTSHGMSAAVDK